MDDLKCMKERGNTSEHRRSVRKRNKGNCKFEISEADQAIVLRKFGFYHPGVTPLKSCPSV